MPATSEPAPGSVIPSAAIRSPRMAGARKRSFWSSVPNFQIGGVAIPMCAPMPADRPPDPQRAELLREHRVVEIAAAAPAVLDRILQPEQTELGHAPEHLVGKPLGRLPLGRMRPQLLGDEAANLGAQLLVLGPNGGSGTSRGSGARGRHGGVRKAFVGQRAHACTAAIDTANDGIEGGGPEASGDSRTEWVP